MESTIQKAIEVVRTGGIIIYPTDTAFGIGCRMDNPVSINKLFAIRKRPLTQATPVLVASRDMALAYFDNPPDIVRRFMDSHWPGALTIVAPCNVELVPSRVRGDGKTIGFRMPNHEVPLQIIKEIGVPMLGPSANFHGDPTPYTLESLNPELVALVDWVVPGVCHDNQASTVVDCSVSPYRVIRQGSIVLP